MGKHEMLLEKIKGRLESNEKINVSVYGLYYSEPSKFLDKGILVATNYRVAFFRLGFYHEYFDTISFNDIKKIEKIRSAIFQLPTGFRFFTSKHKYSIKRIRNEKNIDKFIDYIKQHLGSKITADKPLGNDKITTTITLDQIGIYIKEHNIEALRKVFMKADNWDTRETIVVAFQNLKDDKIASTPQYKEALEAILTICKAEQSGGEYKTNCIETCQWLLGEIK